MGRVNIRTVNGAKHNGHLEPLYSRVQNRAAAVLDAWGEFGESLPLDVVAHIHRISSEQIKKDLFGEPSDIKKRFGIESTAKLEYTLKKCLKEINRGINQSLVAVANYIPFMLLRSAQDNHNIKEVAVAFLSDIVKKLDEIDRENTAKRIDDSIQKYLKLKVLNTSTLRSNENQSIFTSSTLLKGQLSTNAQCFDDLLPIQTKSTTRKRNNSSSSSTQSNLILNNEQYQLSNTEIEEHRQPPLKRLKKLYHRSDVFLESNLQMKWTTLRTRGCGLTNKNERGECKNICYINAIIQCLANTPPFVQWLLIDYVSGHCDLTNDNQFCSVCALRSIIHNIHHNKCNLPYTSTEPLAQNIEKLSSTFVIGDQEDPSEFLLFLLDHLITCLTESSIDNNRCSTPIHHIFGLYLQSRVRCEVCLCESTDNRYENLLSVPIISHSYLIKALESFFAEEKLLNDNLYECIHCKKKTPASKTLQIIQTLPVIFIHLKRFTYDTMLGMTRKIHQCITYPETLDLNPYFDKNTREVNKENNEDNNYVYQLNAVVVHQGNNNTSGHIFAYVVSPNGIWYKMNDELVTSVKIDTVLRDKDSYILCYTKTLKTTTILFGTNILKSPVHSSSLLTSSTPIHTIDKTTNNYKIATSSENICISDYNCLEQDPINNNLFSNEYSTILDEDILSNHSSIQECPSPIIYQSFSENTELSSLQTDSQIEIISRNNNSIYTQQVNKLHRIISPVGTLASSTCERKQSSSLAPDDKRVSSLISRSNYRSLCISPYNSSLLASQRDSSLITSRRAQIPSSVFEDEETLSPTFEPKQVSLSASKNISSGIQLNAAVDDLQANDDFVAELPSNHQFNLRPVDLTKLLVIRSEKNKKKKDRLSEQMGLSNVDDVTLASNKIFSSKQIRTSKKPIDKTVDVDSDDSSIRIPNSQAKQSNVDVRYLYVLLPYVKQLNKYCGLCVRTCKFGVTNDAHRQLLRCNLRCIGHPVCSFTCSVIIQNNGKGYVIVTNRNVRHIRGVKICRPIRAPLRSLIKQQFAQGASVYRMYQEKLQKRTCEQKKGQNYDDIGTSRDTLRKIKSEGVMESLLSPDVDKSVFKLFEKFRADINSDGKVPGAIQYICKYPCQIIIFTESSIRLFDTLLKTKNVVLSWDATGSIIKETNLHHLLYYELSITLPGIVNEDSIVPITCLIGNSHALVNITNWLQLFKHSYSQVFVGKQFPQPRIILSDRAQVFLIASLRIWNEESMNDFLIRAYRIVTGNASNSDFQKTNIHACLAHVLLDSRKTINKYIPETYRLLAMWCIALLINASTWIEFVDNWQLICHVFIQLHLGGESVKRQHRDILMNKIQKIKNDPNTVAAIKSTETVEVDNENDLYTSNVYQYHDSDDDDDVELELGRGPILKRKKIVVDEEKEANATESPFKSTINKRFIDALSNYGVSITDVRDKKSCGILKWFKYLTNFFMPTLPIWSNLLLGDPSRHRRQMVRSFESIIIYNEEQRTTAISERRMGIVKRHQLGGEVHLRLDVLLSILIPDMVSMLEEYWNILTNYCTTNINSSNSIIIDEQRLKPIEERWRQNVSKRSWGHYTKAPNEHVFNDLLSCLLTSQTNLNENIKLPIVNPNWLNVVIGILLSIGNNSTQHYPFTSSSINNSSLLSDILTFLKEWRNSSASSTKSSSINFSLPNIELNQPFEQSIFILEKILIPLLPCHLIINKVYICKSCQSTIKIRSTITSIPVNVSKNGLHLERDLFDYFSPTSSDLLCSKCNNPTIRHIEIIQLPEILLININDSIKHSKYGKPPGILSFGQFCSWHFIACPSASIYDLVCFSSVVKSGGSDTMVRVTKVKKNWLTSMHKRVIGEGEQLRRLYAHSRILVLQRIHHQKNFNFIYAIIQCTLLKSLTLPDDIPVCTTLQEACLIIETNRASVELNNALIANIKTSFYCYSCHKTPDSFQAQTTQIFIFKLTSKNEVVAYPVVVNQGDANNDKEFCTYCNYSSKLIEMNVCKQIFNKCPCYLIRFVDKDVQINDLFHSNIKLTDDKNIDHSYKTTGVLLISRYSDTVIVIKQEAGSYRQYNGDDYSNSTPLSISNLLDLLDTSGSILVFYHQIHTTTQSSMRIISQTNINGAQRLLIQDGNKIFSVTTAKSNTTS